MPTEPKGLGALPGTYHRNDQRNSDGQHEDFHSLHGSDSLTGLDESESRIASPSPMALKFVGVFSVGDERNATPKPRTRIGPYTAVTASQKVTWGSRIRRGGRVRRRNSAASSVPAAGVATAALKTVSVA